MLRNMIYVLAVTLFYCNIAYAKVYKLDFVLAVPGSEPFAGTMINKAGQVGMRSNDNIGLELIATNIKDDQLEITAKVSGYGTVTLITKLNEAATISNESFSLAVTPR